MRPISIESIPINRELYNFPKVIIFEILAGCNLKCIMCPQPKLTRKKGLMDFKLFQKLVDEIAEINPDTEIWSPIMGELFLQPLKIFEYLKYMKTKGLKKKNINTNLNLFKPEYIDNLAECDLNKLTVGLDAATEATYDKVRVGGDFKVVEKNIDALLKAKASGQLPSLEITLQFIVQDENIHEEELFKQKWTGSGATIKIRHKLGWGTGVAADNLSIPDSERNIPCPWLMRTLSIHWTGKAAQCDSMWDGQEYMGDLNQQTISEVWLSELQERRKRHLKNDFNFYPCHTCKDWQCGLSEIYN
ncbi:MAG: radical SAM protein [Bdellovibrionaceae bacterium]|nr:radical SAM protein [Pseudobdellovibrionaceae bacterium]